MQKLLQVLSQNKQKITFLVPAVPKPLSGVIESLEENKITILTDYGGDSIRITTHPYSVVLLERVRWPGIVRQPDG